MNFGVLERFLSKNYTFSQLSKLGKGRLIIKCGEAFKTTPENITLSVALNKTKEDRPGFRFGKDFVTILYISQFTKLGKSGED